MVVATLNTVLLLFMAGLGMGLAGSQSMNESRYLLDLIIAGISFAPAIWVAIGVAVVLFGWFPKRTSYSWAIIVYAFIVFYFGSILQMSDWMMDLSPFNHVPAIPAESFDWVSTVLLTGLAAIFVVVGWIGFRRRDLNM